MTETRELLGGTEEIVFRRPVSPTGKSMIFHKKEVKLESVARPDVTQVFAEDVLSANLHLVGVVIIPILKKHGFKNHRPLHSFMITSKLGFVYGVLQVCKEVVWNSFLNQRLFKETSWSIT